MGVNLAATFDDSVIALMSKAFTIEATDKIVIDQFVDKKTQISAKSIDMTKFAKLAKKTTPLTDGTDVDSDDMVDSKVTLTPAEHGGVVTTTRLANLQTGGKADLAAAQNIAINMVETLNALGCQAGEASTNIRIANGATSESALTVSDLITDSDLAFVHNRLFRANIQRFPGDMYIAIAHPDVISDIKNLSGFESIMKYANPDMVLRNEIGNYGGFRWISTAGMTIHTDAGASGVDTYDTLFFGRNALGKATSLVPHLVYAPAGDKLNRLINVGWYGVLQYKIIDQASLQMITSASSFGDN